MTIFGNTGLTIGLHGVVSHGEVDSDVHKCIALWKNVFCSVFVDLYRCFKLSIVFLFPCFGVCFERKVLCVRRKDKYCRFCFVWQFGTISRRRRKDDDCRFCFECTCDSKVVWMWFQGAQPIQRYCRWICRAHRRYKGTVQRLFQAHSPFEFMVNQFEGTTNCFSSKT